MNSKVIYYKYNTGTKNIVNIIIVYFNVFVTAQTFDGKMQKERRKLSGGVSEIRG